MAKLEKVVEEKATEQLESVKSTGLSQEQGLQLLINAVKVATKRGAFELEETEAILAAIKVFIKQ